MSTYHLHTSNTEILFSLYPSLRKSLQDVNFMDNDHVTNGSNPIKSVSIFSPFSLPPIKTEFEAGVVVSICAKTLQSRNKENQAQVTFSGTLGEFTKNW